jgi:hypothetical protein
VLLADSGSTTGIFVRLVFLVPWTKQQRVREHILRHAPATFRLADIRTAVPGVSDQTIRLALEQLRNEGRVRADGTGRSATWTRLPNTAPSE